MKKSYSAYAVIGLGFGDEGKGMAVHSLATQLDDPLVIRYSGGQQAGHTVTLKDGTSHVFSNFGSGSMARVPTYWSRYCTFDPVGVANEFKVLESKGYRPTLFVDRNCPVTTPYDKFHNQNSEAVLHGTCGAGVGATFAREEKFHSLVVGDLEHPAIFKIKLKLIQEFYKNNAELDYFLECCEFIMKSMNFVFVDTMPERENYIFESSQGLMLDQNIGFFPHVTRSNVGTKNILEMGFKPHVYMITRAFQTRHGNGPMTNTHLPHNIKENPNETNVLNRYQGEFKKSLLDLDLLKYAISRDEYLKAWKGTLVITCLDLIEDELRFTSDGKIVNCHDRHEFVSKIMSGLNVHEAYEISAPDQTFTIEAQNGKCVNCKR